MKVYEAIFESNCPFQPYYRLNKANKSFVRVIDYVKNAADKYSFAETPFHKGIKFSHIHIYDEINELGEVAHMTFVDENDVKYVVTISEFDE